MNIKLPEGFVRKLRDDVAVAYQPENLFFFHQQLNGDDPQQLIDELFIINGYLDEDLLRQKFSSMRNESHKAIIELRSGWDDPPKPGEIAPAPEREPYPIESLPPIVRDAVMEFQRYIKAPLEMVATAILPQMALAVQALAYVGRDQILVGPIGLYAIILGFSGERKSALDWAFSGGAKTWEKEQREERLPGFRRAKAMEQALKERRQAVIKKIGQVEAKGGAEADAERETREKRLQELEDQATSLHVDPMPHLFYEDVTPDALSYSLATGHPSAMLSSAEGGIVLGGHGMTEENALSFQSFLNKLWSGEDQVQVRKTAKAADLFGRVFSISLMIQPDLFQKLVDKGARNLGFLARPLLVYPESTMGTRLYTPPPKQMPALQRFNQRARELLDLPLPVNERYELEPPTMMLSPGALDVWRSFHDGVEQELGIDGELVAVRDVGSKSAENAARLACIFQIWERGPGGLIEARYMEAGVAVAAWYLMEAERIFSEAGKKEEQRDAELLSHWLIHQAPQIEIDGQPIMDKRGRLSTGHILQYGPNPLRDKARRDNALLELASDEIYHIKEIREGKRKMIQVNPWLLERDIHH